MSPADGVANHRVTDRLAVLTERAGVAAGRLATVPADELRQAADAAGRRHARASARLDGSPLEEETAERVDAQGAPEVQATGQQRTPEGWSKALRLDRVPTQDAVALEYAGVRAAVEIEAAVAEDFFDEPLVAMNRLHTALCADLVAADVIARLRQTERAIHDGAQGKMLWSAPTPERLPALMDDLLEWLGGRSASVPTLTVAAVVHERLLEWQPFEAANGRLARSVSRVVRRSRGLDPFAIAVPEEFWLDATLAYHREVAATIRRRGDLTNWIQRTVHAEAFALEAAADALRPGPSPTVPAGMERLVRSVGVGATLTERDVAARLGVSRERAVADLERARRAGLLDEDLSVPVCRYRVAAAARSDRA